MNRKQFLDPSPAKPQRQVLAGTGSKEFYRLANREKRVLVVGAAYPHSARHVDWLGPWPNVSDFDAIIINLKTLDERTLIHLARQHPERMRTLRLVIFELLLQAGEVVVILAPPLAFGSTIYHANGVPEPEWSNYHFSPIGFGFLDIRGESIAVEPDQPFAFYLEQVKRWEGYLSGQAHLGFCEEALRRRKQLAPGEEVFWQMEPLARNRSGRAIAASLCFGVRSASGEMRMGTARMLSEAMHLLPPTYPLAVEEGIELILEEIKGVRAKTLAPEWAEVYELPGQARLKEKMAVNEQQRKALDREQKALLQQFRRLQHMRGLLYEQDDALRHLARRAFQEMGLGVGLFAPCQELFVVETRLGKMIVDCVGRSGPSRVEDLALFQQYAIYAQDDGRIWKSLLILNPFRLDDPWCGRCEALPAELQARAGEHSIGLLLAPFLYSAWLDISQGALLRENFEEQIYRENGTITLKNPRPDPVPLAFDVIS